MLHYFVPIEYFTMLRNTLLVLLLTLPGFTHGFQFLSKFKITPPADLAMEEKVKEKFGDKSKLFDNSHCAFSFTFSLTRIICLSSSSS